MQATAHSKTKSKTRATINRHIYIFKSVDPCPPSKAKSRWPAIILAANRTAKVRGRINDLTVSIITIIGIKGAGVPRGTKWAIILLNCKITDQTIDPSHRGRDKVKVNTKCLEEVKT